MDSRFFSPPKPRLSSWFALCAIFQARMSFPASSLPLHWESAFQIFGRFDPGCLWQEPNKTLWMRSVKRLYFRHWRLALHGLHHGVFAPNLALLRDTFGLLAHPARGGVDVFGRPMYGLCFFRSAVRLFGVWGFFVNAFRQLIRQKKNSRMSNQRWERRPSSVSLCFMTWANDDWSG